MGRILIGNVRNPLADNLTTAENAKYALDAHQGKVLDEKKIDKTSIVNNATTTTTGTVLDGRMGKTLQNGIDELNSNIEIKVVNYELARCTYSSGNVYTQAGRLIINLTVKVNTTINSYDEIIRNLPEIRPNMAALNFFDVTKESKLATCICQNGTVKLIGGSGNLPAINDAIVITGECLLK